LVVVDGKAGTEYDDIPSPPIFSPDGKRVAYGVKKGEKQLVVVDGKAGKEYDEISGGFPPIKLAPVRFSAVVFSPDGKRVAYAAKNGEKWLVVVDGHAGEEYDLAGTMQLDKSHR
jgi:Tol biopolymer transport system component